MNDTIFVASDHAAVSFRNALLDRLKKEFPNHSFQDLGTFNEDSVDYPDFAGAVATQVAAKKGKGILLCGSGIGMCISANKVAGVRAASVWDTTSARLSKAHNDSNIICLGARLIGIEVAFDACSVWLRTSFEGNRHQKRIDKITQLEKSP